MSRNVLTVILAGGKGSRLEPLTRDRAKPAVPFGGGYRIIDFTLSNCINSGLRKIFIFTQYKAASLDRHINLGWRFLCRELNEFIDILPPQQRIREDWYTGTANAVYQNIYSLERHNPDHIVILSGDHIYKMDYAEMIRDHVQSEADATIACIPVPRREATEFGVMSVDDRHRIVDFQEKPANPDPMPDDPNRALASMGIYVFRASFLFEQLCQDAIDPNSSNDFGKNIIPNNIENAIIRAYPFRDRNTGQTAYWRDVGTLDSYYEANMDLVSVSPQLNLYDTSWELRTYSPSLPPPKFVGTDHSESPRGVAVESLVCPGSIISGRVNKSVLGSNVVVEQNASVSNSILFEGVTISEDAQIQRAIIDKGTRIPAGCRIGFDHDHDVSRGYTVTESGIVVVPPSMS